MFVRASDVVGAASALAALISLPPARRREIASCIGLVETIVRKLILIRAADLRRGDAAQAAPQPRLEIIAPGTPSWSACARSGKAAEARSSAEPQAFDPSQPETWRVRFQLTGPRDPQACPESRVPRARALWGASAPPTPARLSHAARRITPAPLRLALRFEAVRRAIADPEPLARKLARALPRLCRRYRQAAERYAIATSRPYYYDEVDPRLIVEAMALALLVAPVFVNSS